MQANTDRQDENKHTCDMTYLRPFDQTRPARRQLAVDTTPTNGYTCWKVS